MKKIIFALILIAGTLQLSAQAPNLNNSIKPKPTERPVDGFYQKTNVLNSRVTPYAGLKESDVLFSKRIWREIDLRDKVNMIFASPKSRLITILTDAIQAGELTAYDASSTKNDVNGDEFSAVLKPEEAMARFADSVLVPTFDKDGNQTGTVVKAGEFNPDSIIKFRIKEDWIFDKQRSVFEPRIVGIAPMVRISAAGQAFDEQPAFWIYFPEARHILVTKAVVNRGNDATGLSYDDIFIKRIFSSYIVKESNTEDLRIKDYAMGIERLYESERVKKALMDFEHDLWSF
jgi:gliding motility associated protien GldN